MTGSGAERATGVQSTVGRDLRINSRAGLCFAHRWGILHRKATHSLPSILLLLSTGVDLRRHEPVVWFLRSLLGADGNQRPRGPVFSGAVWDSGTGFPAALQLHCLEPLRHWHRPGHAEGARYRLTLRTNNPHQKVLVLLSIRAVKGTRLGESSAPVLC